MRTRSATIYSAAVLGGQLLSLCRTLLIARIVGIENQGLVVALGVASGLIESLITLGNSWQVVQAEDGDQREFLGSLQSFNVLRGMLVGGLIVACGPILESVSGLQGLRGPMAMVGLCSVLRGFMNLGVFLAVREHRSGPLAMVEFIPGLVSLVAVLPLAYFTQSVWLYPCVQLVSVAIAVLVSQIASEVPFRLRFDSKQVGTILRFALPLTGAGMVYWGNMQGDRLLLMTIDAAGEAELATRLGLYGTTVGLVLMASTAVSKVMQTLVVPVLSRQEAGGPTFRSQATAMVWSSSLIAVGLGLGVAASLPGIVVLVLGAGYSMAASFLPVVGLTAGIQFLRRFHYLVAMSTGCTSLMFAGNLLRLTGVVVAGALYASGWGLMGIVLGCAIGEVISYATLWFYPATKSALPTNGRVLIPLLILLVTIPWLWLISAWGVGTVALVATPIGAAAGLLGLYLLTRVRIPESSVPQQVPRGSSSLHPSVP